MAILRMVVVAATIHIGRHRRDEIGAVLLAIDFAQLDGCDLGDRIPLVSRLERSGEKRVFGHRLGGKFRVDSGRTERQEFFDANRVEIAAFVDVRL
jgi:hypothetical protein